MSDYGPTCCVGGCCGPGSYCCGHPDNPHEHDDSDLPLDPLPWVVGNDRASRNWMRAYHFNPRPGYSQNKEDYTS